MSAKIREHDNPRKTRSISPNEAAKERLRRRFRPPYVQLLFVGESPPASGRFFYQADSGLYRAIRDSFLAALPNLSESAFLESFRDLGCYLVDLCEIPVDRLARREREEACIEGESRLARTLKRHRPKIVITVVRSITANVQRAQAKAGWRGTHLVLPYPGRWRQHQIAFAKGLRPILVGEFGNGVGVRT